MSEIYRGTTQTWEEVYITLIHKEGNDAGKNIVILLSLLKVDYNFYITILVEHLKKFVPKYNAYRLNRS